MQKARWWYFSNTMTYYKHDKRDFSIEPQFLLWHTIYRAKITRFGSDTREDQWESTNPRFPIRGQTLTGSSKFIRLPGIWYYLHSRVSFVTKWRGTKCMKHLTMWLSQKPVKKYIFKYWCAGGHCYVVHMSTHTSPSGLMELFVCVRMMSGEWFGVGGWGGVVLLLTLVLWCLKGFRLPSGREINLSAKWACAHT